jgi:hypothetical protein
MPPQINISELYSMQKKQAQKRTVCFDKILEMCHNRIKSIAEINGQNTFYEVPAFLLGFPLYNLDECLNYIVAALRKNGFLVQILPKPHISVIYISWDPEELNPPKPMKTHRIRSQHPQHPQIESSLPLIKNNTKKLPDFLQSPPTQKSIMPITLNTRPTKHEPLYLSTLRLF